MSLPHRISAGGFVIHQGKILLVRYNHGDQTYLVAPGGRMEDGESLSQTAEREIAEETGVQCRAQQPILIENLRANDYQMVKLWYLCDYLSGEAACTPGAAQEGILEVRWYSDGDLEHETVYPDIIRTLKLDRLRQLRSAILDPGVRFADF